MTMEDRSPLEPDATELRRELERCVAFVVDHLASLGEQPSADLEGAEELARSFAEPPPEHGAPLERILERLEPAVRKSFNTAGPGYLAYVPGGGLPAAAMADLIASATNRFVGVSAAAPALARIEATVVEWLASLMGYPKGASGILTSGGSLSNFSAVVTARTALLPERFQDGTLYVSREAHHCLEKAARLAGFPASSIRVIPVDARFRMRPDALAHAVREDRRRGKQPFLLIASSGTTNTGAIDPLPELLPIAREQRMWVHADAAYGGMFRLLPEGPTLLPGLDACDSIALDPHKGLFLPYGTGCLLVRDPGALRAAHGSTGAYLPASSEGTGFLSAHEISPELSRPFRGLGLWLPLMLHGVAAFREQLREKLDLARWAWDQLKDDPHLEMLDPPQLSIVAFRFRDGFGDADALGRRLIERVNARRRVYLSGTVIGERFVLRICVLSFRTHRGRVAEAVTALREEAARLAD